MRQWQSEKIARYRKLYPSDILTDENLLVVLDRIEKEHRYQEYWEFRQAHEGEWTENQLRNFPV